MSERMKELVANLVACALIEGANPKLLTAALNTKTAKNLLMAEIEEMEDTLKRINDHSTHLSSGGRDPNEKCYSKRDVEAQHRETTARKHEFTYCVQSSGPCYNLQCLARGCNFLVKGTCTASVEVITRARELNAALAEVPTQVETTAEDLNEVVADMREILGRFNSEDVRVMARRAMERISDLESDYTRLHKRFMEVKYGPESLEKAADDPPYKRVSDIDRILTPQELKNAWAHIHGDANAEADVAGHMRATSHELHTARLNLTALIRWVREAAICAGLIV